MKALPLKARVAGREGQRRGGGRLGLPTKRLQLGGALGVSYCFVSMELRYTEDRVPRGSRPDAASGDAIYLIKSCSELRLTYQIRLLTFMATEQGSNLVLAIREDCRLSRDLKTFVRANRRHLRVETR